MIVDIINEIAKEDAFKIKNVNTEDSHLIVDLEFKASEKKKIDYFLKRIAESNSEIVAIALGDSFNLTIPRDKKSVEEFLSIFKKKYYLIEEPIEESLYIITKLTANCNLDCKYCYDKEFRKLIGHCGILPLEELDHMLDLASKYARKVVIELHGGEPTLAGITYVEKLCKELIPKYSYCDIQVGMQTNGTLINEEWIRLFKENNITPGVSYNALSEKLRFQHDEEEKVINNIKMLNENGIKSGTLDVITSKNIGKLKEIISFYDKNEIRCSLNTAYCTIDKKDDNYLTDIKELSKKQGEYFKYWARSNHTPERYASFFIGLLLTGASEICTYRGDCVKNCWVAINANGDFFPCDRDVERKYMLKNISEISTFSDVFKSESYTRYLNERNAKLEECKKCEFYYYCHGGCPMNDIVENGDASVRNEYECELLKASIIASYDAIKDLLIDNCNPYLRSYIINNNAVLPSEIPELLKYLHIDDCIKYKNDNEYGSSEFNIFQFFNNPNREERIFKDINESWELNEMDDKRFENISDKLIKIIGDQNGEHCD